MSNEMSEAGNKIDIFQINYDYDQNYILPKCKDAILEAKKILLKEQLNKIGNITVSNVNNSRINIGNCPRHCKDSLNWGNELFWKELPNYNNTYVTKVCDKTKKENMDDNTSIEDLMRSNMHKTFKSNAAPSNGLTRKYFNIWKKKVKFHNGKLKLLENKVDRRAKLDKLIRKLKKCRKQEKSRYLKNDELREVRKQPKPASNYKNRFTVQKSIIDMQRAKLEEQNKVIEELRLGIIREDLLKSVESAKINIREIFNDCSERTKCKVPIVIVEEKEKVMLSTQKAPKIIQQMEQRALQRQQNRQMILERKRIIEETRQKLFEEAIKNKQAIEEQERKKSLELIKERRKKELEQEKLRQIVKQRYLNSLSKAVNFYNKMLIKNCFREMYNNFRKCRENNIMASKHYEMKILQNSVCCWCDLVETKRSEKWKLADVHFAEKISKRIFTIWHNVILLSYIFLTWKGPI